MTVPFAARDVAAAAGAVLVLSAVASVVGTVIVPRKTGSRLTRLVAIAVNGVYWLIARPVASYRWRDRIMAGRAAVILLGQLAIWLIAFYVGYALLIWPVTANIGTAFTSVGPALWTFGSPDARGFFETAALDTAAMAGLITVTLQIAYLPHLYAARSIGIDAPAEPAPGAGISLTYAEFLEAVTRLREVAFPLEREPEEAWPHFAGWRVNYEQAARACGSGQRCPGAVVWPAPPPDRADGSAAAVARLVLVNSR